MGKCFFYRDSPNVNREICFGDSIFFPNFVAYLRRINDYEEVIFTVDMSDDSAL